MTINCLRPSTVIPRRNTPRTVGNRASSLRQKNKEYTHTLLHHPFDRRSRILHTCTGASSLRKSRNIHIHCCIIPWTEDQGIYTHCYSIPLTEDQGLYACTGASFLRQKIKEYTHTPLHHPFDRRTRNIHIHCPLDRRTGNIHVHHPLDRRSRNIHIHHCIIP